MNAQAVETGIKETKVSANAAIRLAAASRFRPSRHIRFDTSGSSSRQNVRSDMSRIARSQAAEITSLGLYVRRRLQKHCSFGRSRHIVLSSVRAPESGPTLQRITAPLILVHSSFDSKLTAPRAMRNASVRLSNPVALAILALSKDATEVKLRASPRLEFRRSVRSRRVRSRLAPARSTVMSVAPSKFAVAKSARRRLAPVRSAFRNTAPLALAKLKSAFVESPN